jgi:MscS family membrane protein
VKWRVPGTPIDIARIDEGSREGEFLFSERTVRVAPRFFRGIKATPLRSTLGIESWSAELLQITGPLIPAALVRHIPDSLKNTMYGTPIWKVLAVLLTSLFAGLLISQVHRFVAGKEAEKKIGSLGWKLLRPVSIIVVVMLLGPFIDFQLVLSGAFSTFVDFLEILLTYIAFAWIFWLAVGIFFEWLILSPRIPDESLDADLLRLVAALIGIVGVTIILAFGGETLGLPVLSLLAGLGIGGIAVALAIRPTLENLIGGVILYIDKPVRVGDLCGFGDRIGRVESIGVRSTQLRALDRTLIAIPNAQFVDMQLVNWARCDQMLIEETIGLRYETSPDQLRYVLTKLREMCHAHPRIDNDTVRVRFSGYGDSSLNITIRIFAKTQEWNDFHAIREDVLMRTYDVVTDAGSGFAFPSRTVYMGEDSGLDKKRASAAEKQTETWRHSGRLPFPRLSSERLDQIKDTLDYPPRGSPEASKEKELDPDSTQDPSPEPLSAGEDDNTDEEQSSDKPDKG